MLLRSRSEEETRAAARDLGVALAGEGVVVALVGPLGAGKTAFVRGLAEGLGVHPGQVASPTFVVASEYTGGHGLAHVDLYRIASGEELEQAGFLDLLEAGTVVAVEWADRLPDALPKDRLEVRIERAPAASAAGEPERQLHVYAHGARAQRALERWRARLAARGILPATGARATPGPEESV